MTLPAKCSDQTEAGNRNPKYNHSMGTLLFALLFGTVFSDFPGGNVGGVHWVAENHLRIAVQGQADQDGRNRQANWYYFRVDGASQGQIRIELVDLVGEYNYKPGSHAVSKDTHPVYSYDGVTWANFPKVEWDDNAKSLSVRLTPEKSPFWVAHTPPYTETQLSALESEFDANPMFQRDSAGKTVEGREMPLWTITDPSIPTTQKKTIWLMFRQHAWESGSSWVCDGAIRHLLSDEESAAALRREVVWKIFPVGDPDGVAHGGVRFNRNGFDLNRNWDSIVPEKMPEIASQRRAIQEWLAAGNRIDWFLTLHNTETSEYLEGPAAFRPQVAALRELLKKESSFNPTRKKPEDAAASTDPKLKGRMSVNQALFEDFKIPAMLMEQMISRNDKLGGFPSIPMRRDFGRDLVKAMAKSLR